ncbi:MAG: hypothetical protein RLZZ393_2101 [Pseudomonadota bacterium]|jgi:hypothetical protein
MNPNVTAAEDEEGLDDYDAGFLDGWFHARGIENPTEEQLVEGFRVLDAFIEAHPPEDDEA